MSAFERHPGLARVLTATLHGIEGRRVRVEADVASSLPGFSLVGLPSAALRESRERVGAALRNAGFSWPEGRITVSLAPADLRKDGAAMDLAIAVALLLASGQLSRPPGERLRRTLWVGELALDGALRPPRGTLALALDAAALGFDRMVVPAAAVDELLDGLVGESGIEVVGIDHLRAVRPLVARFDRLVGAGPRRSRRPARDPRTAIRRLGEVRGQVRAKRALVIAAAGGHGLLMQGPPGCGKTMLGRRLVDLLPDLDAAMQRTCHRIRSSRGLAGTEVHRPPLRAPHHSVSSVGLIGGGRPVQPGEITLAHGGVLLLDEIPEFGRDRLDRLREPLTDGRIEIVRAGEHFVLPADFQLVATANPCPCGWSGSHVDRCRCPVNAIERHRRRLSGPLRDRIDLWVDMDREPAESLVSSDTENDAPVRGWVEAVAVVRRDRTVEPVVEEEARHFAALIADRRGLSARALKRSLRVAWTIARLEGQHAVRRSDLAEAFTYRPAS